MLPKVSLHSIFRDPQGAAKLQRWQFTRVHHPVYGHPGDAQSLSDLRGGEKLQGVPALIHDSARLRCFGRSTAPSVLVYPCPHPIEFPPGAVHRCRLILPFRSG